MLKKNVKIVQKQIEIINNFLYNNKRHIDVGRFKMKYIPTKWIQDMAKLTESEINKHKVNLDKRLTHNPFTIFDVEECKKYIGKEGFFSDSAYNFKDIKNCSKGTLTNLASTDGYPFSSNSSNYRYFYPKEELKLETEYKQFTLDSFLKFEEEHGEWFLIRDKNNKIECVLRYNGYRDTENADKNSLIPDGIFLGCECYTFEELFEHIELFYDGEWIPFGERF